MLSEKAFKFFFEIDKFHGIALCAPCGVCSAPSLLLCAHSRHQTFSEIFLIYVLKDAANNNPTANSLWAKNLREKCLRVKCMIIPINNTIPSDKRSHIFKQDCSYQGEALNVPTAF